MADIRYSGFNFGDHDTGFRFHFVVSEATDCRARSGNTTNLTRSQIKDFGLAAHERACA